MKKATIAITVIGALVSCSAITCLAQSFMNYGGTSSSATPNTAPGSRITPLSADDFKSRVTTLGRKNQEKLAQQVQDMLPPSSSSGSGSSPATSRVTATGTPSSSSTVAPSQPAAAPSAPRNNYSGFGTGTGTSAPASSGSSSGSGGFGIKY
jgi:hypothetical protein